MKYIKIIPGVIIAFSLILTSCEKDNLNDYSIIDVTIKPHKGHVYTNIPDTIFVDKDVFDLDFKIKFNDQEAKILTKVQNRIIYEIPISLGTDLAKVTINEGTYSRTISEEMKIYKGGLVFEKLDGIGYKPTNSNQSFLFEDKWYFANYSEDNKLNNTLWEYSIDANDWRQNDLYSTLPSSIIEQLTAQTKIFTVNNQLYIMNSSPVYIPSKEARNLVFKKYLNNEKTWETIFDKTIYQAFYPAFVIGYENHFYIGNNSSGNAEIWELNLNTKEINLKNKMSRYYRWDPIPTPIFIENSVMYMRNSNSISFEDDEYVLNEDAQSLFIYNIIENEFVQVPSMDSEIKSFIMSPSAYYNKNAIIGEGGILNEDKKTFSFSGDYYKIKTH